MLQLSQRQTHFQQFEVVLETGIIITTGSYEASKCDPCKLNSNSCKYCASETNLNSKLTP